MVREEKGKGQTGNGEMESEAIEKEKEVGGEKIGLMQRVKAWFGGGVRVGGAYEPSSKRVFEGCRVIGSSSIF